MRAKAMKVKQNKVKQRKTQQKRIGEEGKCSGSYSAGKTRQRWSVRS